MEEMALKRASSSPHIHAGRTVQGVMLEVIVALAPAGVFGVYTFGWRALLIIAVSVLSAVFWEWLYERMAKKPCTVGDLSAVVTGVLLAYNLPVTVPLWMPVIGALLAIVLVKMIFGGLGANFVNPALTARAILMTSWVGYMSGSAYQMSVRGVDAISGATPLASQGGYELWQLFVGQCPGCIGEVGRVAILVGGLYLIVRGIISWRVPALMLLTLFVCTWLAEGSAQAGLYAVLSGGVFLAAFFMATDYATSPVTPVGKCIMGVGCGLITFVIRRFSSMAEGVSYAVLIMNLTVPLIDRYTRPRVYGEVKKRA